MARVTVTPGGLLAAALVVVVAATCVRLGFWQLERLEARRLRNAALEAALTLPPLELRGDTLAAVRADPEAYRYRRARVHGEPVPPADVVLRGRSLNGQPGVNLISPLRLPGDSAVVLVNRGWAPSPDAATIDPRPLAEPHARTVEGLLVTLPGGDEVRPATLTVAGEGVLTVQRLDRAWFRERTGAPVLPVYLQQIPDGRAPVGLVRLPIPELDEGSHLGYAIQWFSFAVIAVVGFLILLFLPRRATC